MHCMMQPLCTLTRTKLFSFNLNKNLLTTLTDAEKKTLNKPRTHRKHNVKKNVPSITFLVNLGFKTI